jgi:hypothetical protein
MTLNEEYVKMIMSQPKSANLYEDYQKIYFDLFGQHLTMGCSSCRLNVIHSTILRKLNELKINFK